MKKIVIFGLMMLGAGCVADVPLQEVPVATPNPQPMPEVEVETESQVTPTVALPVEGFADHRTFKVFGQFVDDRFHGYHCGDDIEIDDKTAEIPVYSIAEGTVSYAGTINGYGGVIVIAHTIDGKTISAIYGHVDIANAAVKAGDSVVKGERIAMLGDHESTEADGERKHLHFGMYEGSEVRFAGYVKSESELSDWINPTLFFEEHGYDF